MSYAKRWCYTINNPSGPPEVCPTLYDYHVFGAEVGESGTPHYQGFIIFKKPKRLNQIRTLISERGHYEVAKGKNSQASDYCKKDGKYTEDGILPAELGVKGGQATKERYEAAFKLAKKNELDTIDADLLVKHYRTLKQIAVDYVGDVPSLDYLPGIWIYGSSGVGKSSYARRTYPGAYVKNCNKWWDHYQGEDCIIIDDFDDKHACLGHHLKLWGDHYAFTAETKGGSLKIRPKWLVVTSQYCIADIWHDDLPTQEALKRRFKEINFNKHPERAINTL